MSNDFSLQLPPPNVDLIRSALSASPAGADELARALQSIYASYNQLVGLLRTPDPFGGIIRSATVTLTNAQIKAMPLAPYTIVPAPGVGQRLVFLHGEIGVDFTAGAYTNINPDICNFSFQYGDLNADYGSNFLANDTGVASGPVLTFFSDVFGTAVKNVAHFVPFTEMVAHFVAGVGNVVRPSGGAVGMNVPLWLQIDNNGTAVGAPYGPGPYGNLTGGNAANKLTASVLYRIVTY